jgi:copper chaperone CopZ
VHAAENCSTQIDVKVNGLVCDFCARALEKVFGKREEVIAIDVDLNVGQVLITMQPGQTLDDTTITELISDSGYDIQAIKRGC